MIYGIIGWLIFGIVMGTAMIYWAPKDYTGPR